MQWKQGGYRKEKHKKQVKGVGKKRAEEVTGQQKRELRTDFCLWSERKVEEKHIRGEKKGGKKIFKCVILFNTKGGVEGENWSWWEQSRKGETY